MIEHQRHAHERGVIQGNVERQEETNAADALYVTIAVVEAVVSRQSIEFQERIISAVCDIDWSESMRINESVEEEEEEKEEEEEEGEKTRTGEMIIMVVVFLLLTFHERFSVANDCSRRAPVKKYGARTTKEKSYAGGPHTHTRARMQTDHHFRSRRKERITNH